MRGGDLAVFGLQNVSVGSLEDAGARTREALMRGEARGMFAKLAAAATGFNADHFHGRIAQELVEQADGVRTPSNARKKMRGQTFFGGENLLAGFAADDGLKIAHHRGIGMGAENRAEKVVRVADVGDPITHGFVDGVFQGTAAGIDATTWAPSMRM